MNGRLWLLVGVFAAAACDNKPKTSEPAPAPTTPTATPATPAAPAAAATEIATAAVDEIATEEDFEEEARGEISAQNMEAELDKLEKEIGD